LSGGDIEAHQHLVEFCNQLTLGLIDQKPHSCALLIGRSNTAAQICKEISYNAGAMTRMLSRLEAKGLICRAVDEDNRRSHKLALTEDGRKKFPALRAVSSELIDRFFGTFSPTELSEFERLLEKMLARD
jgi:DNA-binding MarR family transcriptional regulator